MLSPYTPRGSCPAGLTCMELALKSLEALSCKNVGLGPGERGLTILETLGSGVTTCTAARGPDSVLSRISPRTLRLWYDPWLEDFGGWLFIHPKGGLLEYHIPKHIPSTLMVPVKDAIRSWRIGGTRGSKGHIVLGSMFALCLDPTHMKEDSWLGQCAEGLDFPVMWMFSPDDLVLFCLLMASGCVFNWSPVNTSGQRGSWASIFHPWSIHWDIIL